jgi:hypothetical protein
MKDIHSDKRLRRNDFEFHTVNFESFLYRSTSKSLFYLVQLNHVRRNCLNAPLGDEGGGEIEREKAFVE